MRNRSLRVRVLIVAALWITVALGAGGYAIYEVFRASALRQFDLRLEEELALLRVAVARVPEDPGRRMTSPAFSRVYSGHYWQAQAAGAAPVASRSLWDARLPLGQLERNAARLAVAGPAGQRLRMLASRLRTPDGRAWRIAVAADLADLEREMRALRRGLLVPALGLVLALVASAVVMLQTSLGPLRELRRRVRAAQMADRVAPAEDFPSEVAPLVEDLNAMVRKNAMLREKGRVQAASLAHALKTPAAILQNELDKARRGGAIDLQLADEAIARISASAERHLADAAPGAAALPDHERTDAGAVLAEVCRALRRLFPAIRFEEQMASPVALPIPAADLQEILGNLLENAGKWADGRVVARLSAAEGRAELAIADDGPGIPAAMRAEVLEEGVRLDPSVRGSGLGLAIVRDLVERYRGRLTLGEAALGGLEIRVVFPQTD